MNGIPHEIRIYGWMYDIPGLNLHDIFVLATINSANGENPNKAYRGTIDTLAKAIGGSATNAVRSIEHLKAAGVIRWGTDEDGVEGYIIIPL